VVRAHTLTGGYQLYRCSFDMLTFQDQYTLAQEITADTDATVLTMLKRDINEGGAMFLNRLGRKFNKEYITADLEDGKQFYQLPNKALRISSVRALHGTFWYTPELIASEDEWNKLNTITLSSNYPIYYYIRGFNEVGLYPIPSTDTNNGLQVSYEPQHSELTQADYTTGTVTVANGSTTLTHSATGFTPQMVGRWLQVTDGTDGKWYRIASYTSTSQLNLENYYEGISGSGRTFRIGEVMKIPQAYQDAPVYYAAERYYLTKNDQDSADRFSTRFDMKVRSAKETYGRSTSQMGIKNRRNGRNPRWIDLTPPVIYP
jgi:hypothetical protein